MQSVKELCGKEQMVWFEVQPKDFKRFLKWAKGLGCKWANGREIDENEQVNFFHFCISKESKLSYIPIFSWVKDKHKFKHYTCKFLSDEEVKEESEEN